MSPDSPVQNEIHRLEILRQFTLQATPFAQHPAHAAEELLHILQTLACVDSSSRVLDSGCGPGIVACALAQAAGQVVGIDLTEAMLKKARERATEIGLTNVLFKPGDMTQLPEQEETFNASVTRFTFHHLLEPLNALREMKRVTRPGGRIVVMDAVPKALKRSRYDEFERLRDPSHTSAPTLEELMGWGEQLNLGPTLVIRSRLEMDLESLLGSSFPNPKDRERLRELIATDCQQDSLDFAARVTAGRLMVRFPIATVAWQKP